LTVLALILMDSPPRKPISKSTQSTFENYATLIISPLSVIENWEDQIKEHIIDDNFSVIVYQGQSHGLLSRHRVILTTYDKVVSEFNPEYQTTLFKLKFKRIVLDEGME
jgi:SWI/SNF-related matrix-associated actin-dependent regulator of chromatin subfamily A3